jgi:eukaryotic-like serine/threonine-protein kinase
VAIASSIVTGALAGLHAAHEAKSEQGEPLQIVHRDVSPQNILVGADGVTRVLDFGVAKAAWRAQTTREGQVKGKISYMAPEQIMRETVDRRCDVYAAALVLWETLTSKRLFTGDNPGAIVASVLQTRVKAPSTLAPGVPSALDELVMRGLSHDPAARFATAAEMAEALERAVTPATPREVGLWVRSVAGSKLELRASHLSAIEGTIGSRRLGTAHAQRDVLQKADAKQDSENSTDVGDVGLASGASLPSGPSQVSSGISVPNTRVASARGRQVLVGGLVALGLVASIMAFDFGRNSARQAPAVGAGSPAPPEATASTPNVAAEPAPVSESASASGSAFAPFAVASGAPSVSAAPAKPAAPARHHVSGASAAPRPVSSASSGTGPQAAQPTDCDPPFTLDDKGVKRFKQGCL